MTRRIAAVVALATTTACAAHVSGDVKVDGVPFRATTCSSGEGRGFPGVELADAQGNRLRLASDLDGSTAVAYFTPANPVGQVFRGCVAMSVQPGTGVVNGVRNLEGSANLACRIDAHSLEGAVRFENCH